MCGACQTCESTIPKFQKSPLQFLRLYPCCLQQLRPRSVAATLQHEINSCCNYRLNTRFDAAPLRPGAGAHGGEGTCVGPDTALATTDGRMTVGSRTDPAVPVAWLPTANRAPGAEEIFTRPATCPRLVGESKHTSLIFIRTHKTGSSTLQSIIHGLETPNHTLIKAGAHLKLVPNSGWQSKYACNQAEFGCPCEFPPRHAIHKSEFARYDIFSRHVTYGKPQLLHSLMRRPPLVVTVIRNSVSHLLSTLLYYDRSAYTPAKLRNDALRLARMRNINATFQGCLYLNGQAHDLGWYFTLSKIRQDRQHTTRTTRRSTCGSTQSSPS